MQPIQTSTAASIRVWVFIMVWILLCRRCVVPCARGIVNLQIRKAQALCVGTCAGGLG